MSNQISAELYEEFFRIAESGDEAAGRKFLMEYFKEFPEETQNAIIGAFVEEALQKKNEEQGVIADFQKQGVEMVNALQKTKEDLQKKSKMLDIKESL
jgi:hypothetical protein